MNHHACVYELSLEFDITLSDIGIVEHADVLWFRHGQLKIDDVRSIKQAAYLAPVNSATRMLVIAAQQITREAQNALLKILEEPPATTRFVLVIPSLQSLLPTVLSRLEIKSAPVQASYVQLTQEFLATSAKDRLTTISELVKVHDRYYLQMFIRSIIVNLGSKKDLNVGQKRVVQFVADYFERSGSSPKMLLEYMAITLPLVTFES